MIFVVKVDKDRDLSIEVDEVLGELVLPHGLAHLIEQVVAALCQLKIAV